jgi:hypothetical protein
VSTEPGKSPPGNCLDRRASVRSARIRGGLTRDEVWVRHECSLACSEAQVGALLDSLGSTEDRLWPREGWPAQHLDRPLQVGAIVGHGPVRYRVEAYEQGRRVRYRFLAPRGFDGWHEFSVQSDPVGTRLLHTYNANHRGLARILWRIGMAALHDAATRDCLAKARREVEHTDDPVRHPLAVRALRLSLPAAARIWPAPTARGHDG